MKTRLTILAAAILAALILTRPAAAADSKVKGRVTDSQGQGIGGAAIEIKDPTSGRSYRLKSGKDGSFYQRGVLPSLYVLTVEHEGFTSHIIEDVKVQAGIDRSFEIKLRSMAERRTEQLKEKGLEGYASGSDAFKAGDFETALLKADQAIAERPADAKGYDLKAKALISLKRYAEAIPLLEQELALAEPVADARQVLIATTFNAGVAASREDKVDEAIARWEKAVELGYADPQVHRLLGDAFLQKQDYGRARQQLEAYLAKNAAAKDAEEVKVLLGEIQKLEVKK